MIVSMRDFRVDSPVAGVDVMCTMMQARTIGALRSGYKLPGELWHVEERPGRCAYVITTVRGEENKAAC